MFGGGRSLFIGALQFSGGGGQRRSLRPTARPFPGEKKTEWLEDFSPTFQMFLEGEN